MPDTEFESVPDTDAIAVTRLRIGVAGLGRAFSMMMPTFAADKRIEMVAGADPRAEARAHFERDFGAKTYESVEKLCADAAVQVVYIATPHQFHAENAIAAAQHGKHVLVEKPMALKLEECHAMITASRKAGVQLIVGHSHSFDAPIAKAREVIAAGALGRLRMITAINYTDFLYRPRRPEELETARGGGVVFNQAAHHVDVVRRLAGSAVTTVRAFTGNWDATRPTEGAYSALLGFDDGAFASLAYSGYAHFDSDEFTGWIAESGAKKDPASYGVARRLLHGDSENGVRSTFPPENDSGNGGRNVDLTPFSEVALKNERNYGGAAFRDAAKAQAHQHFGLVIASCEHGDVRPLPSGVVIYGDAEIRTEPLAPPDIPRVEVIDELYEAVMNGGSPFHSGEWAMANLEVCLAILRSAREGREVKIGA